MWESANKSPFSSLTILHLGWYPFLKSLMPLYKSLMFWILLLVSSFSILDLRYASFLFLKCLLTSRQSHTKLFIILDIAFKSGAVHIKHTYKWGRTNFLITIYWTYKSKSFHVYKRHFRAKINAKLLEFKIQIIWIYTLKLKWQARWLSVHCLQDSTLLCDRLGHRNNFTGFWRIVSMSFSPHLYCLFESLLCAGHGNNSSLQGLARRRHLWCFSKHCMRYHLASWCCLWHSLATRHLNH